MDFAIFGWNVRSSEFAAVEVEKKSLQQFMSSNAKENEAKTSNKNLTLYPDLIPTLAGNLRVSTSKLMVTTDSSIGCQGFTMTHTQCRFETESEQVQVHRVGFVKWQRTSFKISVRSGLVRDNRPSAVKNGSAIW